MPGRLPAVRAATARPAFPGRQGSPGLGARQGWVRASPSACLTARPPRRFLQDSDPDVRARTDAGLAKFRGVAERALTAAGLHLPAGGQLWGAYRRSPCPAPPWPPLPPLGRTGALARTPPAHPEHVRELVSA